jgi:hypothetical protein
VLPTAPVKLLFGEDGVVTVPPDPETMDHVPDPLEGVFAERATEVPQRLWSDPAAGVLRGLDREIVMSSVEGLQIPLVIVQRSVYVTPAFPVNVDEGLALLENVPPAPVTTDQLPVPDDGVFAASVDETLQMTWSDPALAGVGGAIKTTVTSSLDDAQVPLEIVHLNV